MSEKRFIKPVYRGILALIFFLSLTLISVFGCGSAEQQAAPAPIKPDPPVVAMKTVKVQGIINNDGKVFSEDGGTIEKVAFGEYLFTFARPFAETPEIDVTVDDPTAALFVAGLTRDYAQVYIFQFMVSPYEIHFVVTGNVALNE